jgi:hypothetical protein
MGSSLASLLTPLTDRLWSAWFTTRDAEVAICRVALDRIREEKPKFQHIVANRPYNNSAYKKAITESSFKLLFKDMTELSHVWQFRRRAIELSRSAEQRDAGPRPRPDRATSATTRKTDAWREM